MWACSPMLAKLEYSRPASMDLAHRFQPEPGSGVPDSLLRGVSSVPICTRGTLSISTPPASVLGSLDANARGRASCGALLYSAAACLSARHEAGRVFSGDSL